MVPPFFSFLYQQIVYEYERKGREGKGRSFAHTLTEWRGGGRVYEQHVPWPPTHPPTTNQSKKNCVHNIYVLIVYIVPLHI